jgi:LacI family transcriptional regulator
MESMIENHRPPTSADVARLAGVSRTTVSYVLNNTPNLSLKQETRERVLAAARELNYQLQPAARALRKGQSDDIYFVADRPLTLYFRDLILAYHRRARELGYNLIVCFNDDISQDTRRDFLVRLFSNRPAGVIFSGYTISQEIIDLANSKGAGPLIPLGTTQTDPDAGQTYNQLVCEGTSLVIEHLVERGHRTLGVIAPQPAYLATLVETRVAAARESLETPGLGHIRILPAASSSLAEARRIVKQLRDDPSRPTAIFGFNDEYCFALLRALHEQGFRVPEDMAVVGTDNLDFAETTTPSLTTVSYDIHAIGARTIDLIDARLRSDDDVSTSLPFPPLPSPTLIIREST